MPYWGVYCLYCQGYISDALLECIPVTKRTSSAFRLLDQARPGAAFACPYCNELFGFDNAGNPCPPESGWPVFRYSMAELETKKLDDGELAAVSLADWALRYRFMKPGTHDPMKGYLYAEQAPPDETVP